MGKHANEQWYATPTAGHDRHGQGAVVSEADGRTIAVVYDCEADGALLAAAPALLAALDSASKGFEDILSNHPDVWPHMGVKANQTPERAAWRDKIKGFWSAVRAAIERATGD